jgi:hypothetical protein
MKGLNIEKPPIFFLDPLHPLQSNLDFILIQVPPPQRRKSMIGFITRESKVGVYNLWSLHFRLPSSSHLLTSSMGKQTF